MGKTRDLANLVDYISVDGSGNVSIPTLTGVTAGVSTVTAISGTANANGATISGSSLTLTPADGTNGGVMTASTQTIAGLKTFKGTTASDLPSTGTELLTTGTGTGWTGTSFATGYTHSSGSTTVLTPSFTVTSGQLYYVSITISGLAGGGVILAWNGATFDTLVTNGTFNYYRKASSTTGLTITGVTGFGGVVIASLKLVSAASAVTTLTNSGSTTSLEFRVLNTIGNTVIGRNTGTKIISGTYNTVLGDSSLGIVDGSNNTVIGYNALTRTASSSGNIAIGNNTLSNFEPAVTPTAGSNIAIGNSAMINAIGNDTVAIGNSAMASGNLWSVAVGNSAGLGGAGNVAIGYGAIGNTSTDYNTAVGYNAGKFITGGATANTGATNSIYIGANAYPLGITQANQIVIGYGSVGGGANTTTIGNSSTISTIIPSSLLLQTYLTVGLGNGADANSVALGRNAMSGTQTGVRNTAIGYQTLAATHSGSYDTAIGFSALTAATSGGNNTAIGGYSGNTITTGANNLILSGNVGIVGGLGITTGSNNTIVGQNITGLATSLANNIILSDGAGNIRFQYDGTNTILGQSGNVGIGASPTYNLDVTGTGRFTGSIIAGNSKFWDGTQGLVVGAYATGGGYGAIYSNSLTAGASNFAFATNGTDTYLGSNGSATGKIIFTTNIGATQSMIISSTGNVGIGTSSPSSQLEIYGATGAPLTDGIRISRNTLQTSQYGVINYTSGILNLTGVDISGGGALRMNTSDGTTTTERMRITSGGDVTIGTTTISARLSVLSDTITKQALQLNNPNGTTSPVMTAASITTGSTSWYAYIAQSGNGTSITTNTMFVYGNGNLVNLNGSYGTISDIKLKENIIDATPKLANLMKLKVRNFNLIADENKTKQIGFIAQEFEEIFPGLIEETPDKDLDYNNLGTMTKTIKTSVLVPMLVKAIQEQNDLITDLTNRLNALENK